MDLIIGLVFKAIEIYSYAIIIYILMSWFPGARESTFGELLGKIVEPYLEPFRKLIPPIGGMIDISPIIAILVLNFATRGLAQIITFLL